MIAKAQEQFKLFDTLPIVINKDEGNVIVRQAWDGDKLMSMAEVKVVEGLVPEDFKEFFGPRWAEASVESNGVLEKVDDLEEIEGHKVVKLHLKMPWPLWSRNLINTLYPRLD